jgi:glycosyltransferase involved in cell wall biosynthesis
LGIVQPTLCLFTDSLEPSGLGVHMLALAEELRGAFRTFLVCPPSPATRWLLDRGAELGLETLALNVRGRGAEAAQLQRWLQARRIEIFHGHAGIGWEGHAGVYAARAAEVPVVLRTEHLPYLLTASRQQQAHARLLQALDALVCVSEGACASFLQVGVPREKLRVIRNGIHARPPRADRAGLRARLGLEPGARLILTVARFTEQKGHHYLLEAAPAVLAAEPRAQLVWVGRGLLESRLRARVRALGLESQVLLVGQRSDTPDLIAAADLFVLPSLFEGLPLVVLEAMAAGLPVIGTRVCGTSEAIVDGETGRLVPAKDPTALAQAILECLGNAELLEQWGQAGQRWLAREFSAARMARQTAALYLELIRRAESARWWEEGASSARVERPADTLLSDAGPGSNVSA